MTNATTTNNSTPFTGWTPEDIEVMRILLEQVKLPWDLLKLLTHLPEFSDYTPEMIQRRINTVPSTVKGVHQITIPCNFGSLVRGMICFCPLEAGQIIAQACEKVRADCRSKAREVWDKEHICNTDEVVFDPSSVEYPIDIDTCRRLVCTLIEGVGEALSADIMADPQTKQGRDRW